MRLIDELLDHVEILKDSGSLRAVEQFVAMVRELYERGELSSYAFVQVRSEIEDHFGV